MLPKKTAGFWNRVKEYRTYLIFNLMQIKMRLFGIEVKSVHCVELLRTWRSIFQMTKHWNLA